MSEEENQSVEETQEAIAQATESEGHNDVSIDAEEAEQRKRNDAEYNWGEMRRQMREKDQQIDELRNQFSQISNRAPSQEEDDELARLAEDDILTVAQAKKLATKMAKNVAEEVLRTREMSQLDERMSLKYPDFHDVVSQEKIELLKRKNPGLAKAFSLMKDPIEQAEVAYTWLKSSYNPSVNTAERRKVAENSQKPISTNAVTNNSAIGSAHLFENGLTKDLKTQLYKEMQQAMKQA